MIATVDEKPRGVTINFSGGPDVGLVLIRALGGAEAVQKIGAEMAQDGVFSPSRPPIVEALDKAKAAVSTIKSNGISQAQHVESSGMSTSAAKVQDTGPKQR